MLVRPLILLLFSVLLAWPTCAQETLELTAEGWQPETIYDPETPEGQLQAIRKLLAQGDADEALDQTDAWIKRYPNSPLMVEARLLKGDAKVAKRSYYKALFDYEYVIRTYPASEQFHTALEREFEIARLFVNGMKRKLLGMRIIPAEGEGEELLIRIQERAPGSALGEKASLLLGDYYFREGQMGLAADAYDLFLINYPNSRKREWVMLRLIQASLARFKGPQFDPTGLIDAQTRLLQYEREYPAAAEQIGAEALLVRIEESLALKDLTNARWYERRGQLVSAAYMYRRIVEEHPTTAAAESAVVALADLPRAIKSKSWPDTEGFMQQLREADERDALRVPEDAIQPVDEADAVPSVEEEARRQIIEGVTDPGINPSEPTEP